MGKILRALGYVWALPVSLVGLLLGLIFRGHTWEWASESGCLVVECPTFPGPWKPYVGITLGWVVLLAPGWGGGTVVHELVHVRQCKWLGPLILLAYPLCSLVAVMRGGHWYQDNWLERQARIYAGQ